MAERRQTLKNEANSRQASTPYMEVSVQGVSAGRPTMSTQSTSTFDGFADWTARKDAGRKLLAPVRCLGFWSAVVLPLVLFQIGRAHV